MWTLFRLTTCESNAKTGILIFRDMNTMNKKLFFTAILSLVVIIGQAQDNKFKISFKGNPNLSWMTPQNNHIEASGSSLRFGYGVDVDIMFTNNYAIGTGLSIQNAGGKLKYLDHELIDNTRYIMERTRDYNLKYVEIPVTLKLRTNEIGYITYYGQFGLGLGVNVGARADDKDDYLFEYSEPIDQVGTEWHETSRETYKASKIEIGDEIGVFRTSLIIGAGLEYNLQGSTSIVAGITFNNGFNDVLKNSAIQRDMNGEAVFENQADEFGFKKEDLK